MYADEFTRIAQSLSIEKPACILSTQYAQLRDGHAKHRTTIWYLVPEIC